MREKQKLSHYWFGCLVSASFPTEIFSHSLLFLDSFFFRLMRAAPVERSRAVVDLLSGWLVGAPCSSNELPQDTAQQCGLVSTLHSQGEPRLLLLPGGEKARKKGKRRRWLPPVLLPMRAACEWVDKLGWGFGGQKEGVVRL